MKLELLRDCEVNDRKTLAGTIIDVQDEPLEKQLVEEGIAKPYFEAPVDRTPVNRKSVWMPGGDDYTKAGASGDGFRNLGELLKVVKDCRTKGLYDERLKGLTEGTGADGGFLVPQGFASEILRETLNPVSSPILGRCRVVPVSLPQTQLPAIDEASRASSVYGGILFRWLGETQTKEESAPKFRQIGINLHKLAGLCTVSDELLDDSAALTAVLPSLMAEALRFQVADTVINGDGMAKPLGVLNSGCLVTITKEVSQAAGTILYANILKMFARLAPSSHTTAAWVIHVSCIPTLYQMTVNVKNVAGTENVGGSGVLPAGGGFAVQELFGLPVVWTELAHPLGTKGDIILADFGQYLLCQKGELRIDVSNAPRFTTDETVYRIVYRVDGMPWWNTPRTPRYGSDTVSPFVTLETRS